MDKFVNPKTGMSLCARFVIALLLFVPAMAAAQAYSVLHEFLIEPIQPVAPLVQGIDGNFYGTTSLGGSRGGGTVFKMDSTGNLTALHSFDYYTDGSYPSAGLLRATDGGFYGTTARGGPGGRGTVFKMDPFGALTTLFSFSGVDGDMPSAGLIQANDGNFYGTTTYGGANGCGTVGCGTVFRMNSSGTLTTLHSFAGSDGYQPYAGLIQATDGNFYGTTDGGGPNQYGTVFKMDSAGELTTLYSFSFTDGSQPRTGLIQATDGSFYGTTMAGGTGGCFPKCGTIFKIDSAGNLTTLHLFTGSDGSHPIADLIQATDGNFYGTASTGGASGYGTLFKMDSAGNVMTFHTFNNTDGSQPYAGLIQADDGNFYGTTQIGGASNGGTAFKIDLSGNLTTLYNFTGGSGFPYAGLIQATDGNFYGTTSAGGASGQGTLFKMDSSGNLTTLHSFNQTDGYYPEAGLIQATDGNFYGTTSRGGGMVGCDYGCGTFFRVASTGNLTTLHSFAGSEGSPSDAGIIQATDGNFYGTTSMGGASGYGAVFAMDSEGNLTTLHSFVGSDGSYPDAGLIQATDGKFYGTTSYGGASGYGTVFEMEAAGSLTTLHSFAASDGSSPRAGLLLATDGNFYGTTRYGGAGNCTGGCGTVFIVDSSGNLTTLHSFDTSDGAIPDAGLIQAADGNLYGTTDYGGANGFGSVFKMDSSGNLTTIHSFASSEGSFPRASLIQATNGSFYGTATYGGTSGSGVIYRIELCSPPVASSNSPVCAGQTLQLSAFPSSGATYSWTGPNGFASTLQAPSILNATAADSGTYTVTVTAGTCAPAQASVDVAVNPGVPPAPVISPLGCVPPNTPGLTASVAATAGDTYNWTIAGGTITGGQGTNIITFTSREPGVVIRLTVVESNTSCSGSDTKTVQVDFADMPASNHFHDFVCGIARNGITAGCGGGYFCPIGSHLRDQMAVFILRAAHGPTYIPPAATGTMFSDVTADSFGADFIEEAGREGVMGVGEDTACGANLFCPNDVVTRLSMAYILLRGEHGGAYVPPSANCGIFPFLDVPCPSQDADFMAELIAEGITAGCDATHYCPTASLNRAQMAVFLTVTFSLP
jgi:uncharacterized repeat protein (TIGR03803 family)